MKSRILLVVVIVGLIVMARFSAGAEEGKWEKLFDGKTLNGWVTAKGEPVTKGWEVQDGAIVRMGHGGDIYTKEEYGDFELKWEWKISPGVNSGVKYRMTNYTPGGLLGLEYQMEDDGEWKQERDRFSTASIYEIYAPNKEKKLKPVGEWNESKIVCRGSHIEHWINGAKVAEADTSTAEWKEHVAGSKFKKNPKFGENRSGKIMLQDHPGKDPKAGDKVWFRNMEIRKM